MQAQEYIEALTLWRGMGWVMINFMTHVPCCSVFSATDGEHQVVELLWMPLTLSVQHAAMNLSRVRLRVVRIRRPGGPSEFLDDDRETEDYSMAPVTEVL